MEDKLKEHKIFHFVTVPLLILAGPVFILFTDPDKLPLPLLILPFIWLFGLVAFLTIKLLTLKTSANKRQIRYISLLLAGLPVLLLVFQSIHQLSIRDVLLSVGIVILAALYMLRADFIK